MYKGWYLFLDDLTVATGRASCRLEGPSGAHDVMASLSDAQDAFGKLTPEARQEYLERLEIELGGDRAVDQWYTIDGKPSSPPEIQIPRRPQGVVLGRGHVMGARHTDYWFSLDGEERPLRIHMQFRKALFSPLELSEKELSLIHI